MESIIRCHYCKTKLDKKRAIIIIYGSIKTILCQTCADNSKEYNNLFPGKYYFTMD